MIMEFKSTSEPPTCFNSCIDHDGVLIMEFHGHKHRFRWYYASLYHIATFTLEKNFMLSDYKYIKTTLLNYVTREVLNNTIML